MLRFHNFAKYGSRPSVVPTMVVTYHPTLGWTLLGDEMRCDVVAIYLAEHNVLDVVVVSSFVREQAAALQYWKH